jgi:hypothetical protein
VSLILPILIFAVAIGLTVKRPTPAMYVGLIAWILAVSIHFYLKN